jgi:secreted trypsin-like serine protease
MRLSRRLRTLALAGATVGAMLTVAVAPAAAITDGALDGNGHPYVALMVAKDADGNPLWRCSGTLLAPTVYLTAGHCTEAPAASAEIFLASGPINTDAKYVSKGNGGSGCDDPAVTGYPCHGDRAGSVQTHPDYNPDAFFVRDAGVVLLSEGVSLSKYGALPSLDQFDAFKGKGRVKNVTFTAVGYGLQQAFPDASSWKDVAIKVRMVSHPKLVQINNGQVGDFSMQLSNNTNTGGTCFGDSGGPNFLGSSNVVAGVTSYGKNWTCGGSGGVFRMDRSWSLDWINGFLP